MNLLADFAGGGMMCAFAIVTALYEKLTKTSAKSETDNTKQNFGKVIDLSMVEGAAYISSWLWTSRDLPIWNGKARGISFLDGGAAAYETYETKDGLYIACGAVEPQFYQNILIGWHRLIKV